MSTIKQHHQSAMFYRGNCLGSPHTGYGPDELIAWQEVRPVDNYVNVTLRNSSESELVLISRDANCRKCEHGQMFESNNAGG